MQLSESDLLDIERDYCARSLANFAKRAWHILEPATDLKWGWCVDSICEHLEAVTRGEIRRLLINVPPGTMKSLLTSVIWPAWEWGPKNMPSKRFLSTAHKEELAIRDSTKCRRLIKSDWYQKLWPIGLTGDVNAKKKFENTATGFREAMAFGSMTGSRGDRVIIDDPHSVDDANSATKLMSDVTTFREAVPTRVNNEASAIVIIMQRLAVGDVAEIALSFGYQHLLIPMRYEAGRSKNVTGMSDPRTKEGELMFPDRFTPKMVEELELILGPYGTAGQLQQRPNPRGGRIIKTEWFKTYTQPPTIKHRWIYADTAQKTKEHNDYSVFQCWGKGDDGKAYLLDQLRGKWEAPDLKMRCLQFWLKHKAEDVKAFGALRGMKIEDKASGTGLIQDIQKHHGIPVHAIERVKDKYTRLLDVLGYIESGHVYIPADAPYISDFLSECESFTGDDSHAHDDQIDPMIDAINDLLVNHQFVMKINPQAIALAKRR
jgi:predicted phage terminase large subunit-like protein